MRKIVITALFLLMATQVGAVTKTYSADLPTAGRQRSPVALTTLFNDLLSWVNDIFDGTDSVSSTNKALLSDGNGSFALSHIIRSTVPLQHIGGNGTLAQVMISNGDGKIKWTTSTPLTTGDKGDITVSNGGSTWLIDNNTINSAKITNGSVTYADFQSVSGVNLIGRASSGSGNISAIPLADHLSISSTKLSINGTKTLVSSYSENGSGSEAECTSTSECSFAVVDKFNSLSDPVTGAWVNLNGDTLAQGDTYKVYAIGKLQSTSTPTMRFKVKLGSTALVDTGAITSPVSGLSGTVELFGIYTVHTTGSSGKVIGNGYIRITDGSTRITYTLGTATQDLVSVNTTNSNNSEITWQWGSSGNIVHFTNVLVQKVY